MGKEYSKESAEITENEPYIQLELSPPAGYMGIKVKQKTAKEAMYHFDNLCAKYHDVIKNVPAACLKDAKIEAPDFGVNPVEEE